MRQKNKSHYRLGSNYRFKRILSDMLDYLKKLPNSKDFAKCQEQFFQQIDEIIAKGFTWGFEYPLPVHDSDMKSLSDQEWISIKSIVSKQSYGVSSNNR